jgi:DNA-binding transcriptional regulator YhcF (GntR family)
MSQAHLEGLAVDRDGELPIWVQLAWELRARVCDGRFSPGERLPGVREMAELAGVNANTVRAVYQRLEREGLIESRHGTGTFVSGGPAGRSDAGELAAAVARQARERGMDPREVAAALYVTQDAEQGERRTAGAARGAERRRELRGQIAALAQALAEIEAANPGLLAPPADSPRLAGPRLLSAQELEGVKARLVRRLADAQLALDATTAEAGGAGARSARQAGKAPAKGRKATSKDQPAVQSPVPTGRPARSKTLATVKLATP